MRILITTLFLLLGTSFAGGEQPDKQEPPSREEQSRAEQELTQLEREWVQADLTYDTAWYQRHLAEDYTSTSVTGKVSTKAQEIQSASARTQVRESHAVDDLKVRLYGPDVAVVTGRVTTRQGPRGGRLESYQLRFTDVFVRRDGRWQVVANQNTRVSAGRDVAGTQPP